MVRAISGDVSLATEGDGLAGLRRWPLPPIDQLNMNRGVVWGRERRGEGESVGSKSRDETLEPGGLEAWHRTTRWQL